MNYQRSINNKIKVGYPIKNYQYDRCIIDMVDNAEYVRTKDFYSILRNFKMNKKSMLKPFYARDYMYKFNDLGINQVDLLHFYNVVSYGKTPWITTFETKIPRFLRPKKERGFNGKVKNALKQMAGHSCKALIAKSQCNLSKQTEFLKNHKEYEEQINKKLIVLHPPQNTVLNSYEEKKLKTSETIKFILVGSSFFRKGGVEVVETFKELIDQYQFPIELTIISALKIDNYATRETLEDIDRAKKFIENNNSWIKWYPKLANREVIELMKESHVGLLPTYADSYGFSVLELQASGCPCITTDVRALPEINNQDVGWIINIPKNDFGEAYYTTKEDRKKISMAIRQGLKRIVEEIFEHRSMIAQKGQKAILRIKNQHSLDDYRSSLSDIYDKALMNHG